jgi:O-antigen/teichoic acid export membrane protein
VASSTVIYAAVFVTAPYLARLLGSPAATIMVRVMCVSVIIDGFAAVPLALLDREFAQGRRMAVDALNFVVSTGVTLWLAFAGKGPIGFAWGSVAGCTVALAAALVLAPHFILPGWNTAQARKLLGFGLPLAGAGLLMLGVVNVDSAIVGATLGPAMLGLYQLAFNVSSWPVTVISQAVARVSFAGFSRVADSTKMLAEAFARAMGLLMALTVPACVLLATLAGPLIHAIYGERWVPAAHALSLLALLGMLRVAYQLMYDLMAAAGKRNALMGVQGLWLAALIPVLLIGARLRGIAGVSAGHILVAALLVGPSFLWSLSRAGIRVRRSSVVGSWQPCHCSSPTCSAAAGWDCWPRWAPRALFTCPLFTPCAQCSGAPCNRMRWPRSMQPEHEYQRPGGSRAASAPVLGYSRRCLGKFVRASRIMLMRSQL